MFHVVVVELTLNEHFNHIKESKQRKWLQRMAPKQGASSRMKPEPSSTPRSNQGSREAPREGCIAAKTHPRTVLSDIAKQNHYDLEPVKGLT